MQTYSISEGRKVLGDLVNQVKYKKTVVALGRNNKTEALLIPYEFADSDLDMTAINQESISFDFLEKEPDCYELSDLKVKYV